MGGARGRGNPYERAMKDAKPSVPSYFCSGLKTKTRFRNERDPPKKKKSCVRSVDENVHGTSSEQCTRHSVVGIMAWRDLVEYVVDGK
jgi:hypothetical protein